MEGFRQLGSDSNLFRRLRFRLVIIAATASGAVGCHTTKKDSGLQSVTAPPAAEKSGFLGMGGSKQKFGPPPEQVQVVSKPRKPTKGMKPETDIAIADTELEAALEDGRPAVQKDQFMDAARQRYTKALVAEPKNKAALIGLARLYEKTGDRARSSQMYQDAMKVSPKDHELPYQHGKMLARGEQWTAASDAIQKALAIDSENRTYQKTLGYCLARNSQWDAAFGTMLKVMPEADARYFLGRVLLDVNREPDAKQQFELALHADRNHVGATEVLAELAAPAPTQGVPEPNPIQTTGFQGK